MILVTGARGFLGSRVCANLADRGLSHMMTDTRDTDLCYVPAVRTLFDAVRPTAVIHCASHSGGIGFNAENPASIFRENTRMGLNVIEACTEHKARLVSPIANCAYPGRATFFREAELEDGPCHPSVAQYGFTRRAMLVGAEAYREQFGLDAISLCLSNMFGPGDHLDEVRAHALGALVVKILRAKKDGASRVEVWGTGTPVREWLYVDDGAEALVRAVDCNPIEGLVNIGTGHGISVKHLAEMIQGEVGYEGRLFFDTTKPDGAPMKTVDGSRGERWLGWAPEVTLAEGIRRTVAWAREALS